MSNLTKLAQAMMLAAANMDRIPAVKGSVTLPADFRDSFTALVRDTAAELDDIALEAERE